MAKARLDDPLSADQLRSVLDYHPKIGIFIWRHRPDAKKEWNTRYAGTVAGTPTIPRGYVQVLVFGRLYLAHRLAFLWMTGNWPNPEADHRDGNPANNVWANLRIATSSQNKMNRGRRSDNTSGYKGVWLDKRRGQWVSEVWVDGKKQHLGYFPTVETAKAARDKAARRLHGKFARTD